MLKLLFTLLLSHQKETLKAQFTRRARLLMIRGSGHFTSRSLFLFLMGTVLLIAACGGGGNSSSGTTHVTPATEPSQGPFAKSPYKIATFAGTPPAGANSPDDLAISADGMFLWVGYGNGVDTFGKGGPSTLVKYDISTGNVLRSVNIQGHLDGLKINPVTNDIWATENEDGNPTLTIVNAGSGGYQTYTFAPALLSGGMDDLVFTLTSPLQVFIVASSQTDISLPVIVQVPAKPPSTGTQLTPTAFLPGDPARVVNIATDGVETADMIGDPDSMTLDPAGDLVLDNRSDSSLYIVSPSVGGPVQRLQLTIKGAPVQVNDTIWTQSTFGVSSPSGTGAIFITDTNANAIYVLTKPFFPPAGEAYTAAVAVGVVGLVDLQTGAVSPVATGFQAPNCLAFAPFAGPIATTH